MRLDLDFGLVAAAVASTVVPGCSWAHPGANPYRGDPVAALADFHLPDDTRRRLKALMAAHTYTDVVAITRDDIVGNARYGDLREMHSGHGEVCHGAVDRSAWDAARMERGLVYCADDACVIVPTICNNVSMVTRRPEEHAGAAGGGAPAEGPIDIEPAAGPPRTLVTESTLPPEVTPGPIAMASPLAVPGNGGFPTLNTGIGFAGGGAPFGDWPGGGSGGGVPSIPEPAPGQLLAAGAGLLAALRTWRRRSAAGGPPSAP